MLTGADFRRAQDQGRINRDFGDLIADLDAEHEAALARLKLMTGDIDQPIEAVDNTRERPRVPWRRRLGQLGLYGVDIAYKVLDRMPWRRDQRDPSDVQPHHQPSEHELRVVHGDRSEMAAFDELLDEDHNRTDDTLQFPKAA